MKNIIKIASLLFLLLPVFSVAQDKTFLKKYAGTYNMLVEGDKATPTTDKYVLSADGKCVWTIFQTINGDGSINKTPIKTQGTWTASEGVINLQVSPPGADGGHGEELISEFKLEKGVFRSGNLLFKKAGAGAAAKSKK